MSKTITLKLTLGGGRIGPFTITDDLGNIVAEDVPKDTLINGVSYVVEDSVINLTIQSKGLCTSSTSVNINKYISSTEIANSSFKENKTSSLWKHLTDISKYNNYYRATFPYILEYPFAYQFQDEILQSVKDYSKVYKYIPDGTGVFNGYEKVESDEDYFNKLIVYNDQQNSGILELEKKPKNNLKLYNSYPIYRDYSKVILYTKSDSFYNVNNFWNVIKNKAIPQWITDCNTLSIDKRINETNMDYSKKSFKKELIRGKYSKVRYILDNKSDIHIVSKINCQLTMNSYK